MWKQIIFLTAIAAAGACKRTDRNAPDNTARNADQSMTNGDQAAQSGTDLELTKNIRQAVVDDGSLSTNAHNAKIIVVKGVATLAGPVDTEVEKAKLIKIASEKGARSVVDQLEVVKSTANR